MRINRNNEHFQIVLDGHALFNPGNDIVCAGISSLIYAFAGTIKNNNYPKKIDLVPGHSVINVVDMDQYLKGATDQLIIGLLQIQKKYEKNLTIKLIDSL